MEEALISIIVPVYKVEKYLNRCVESIVNQTYKNLEIILVDDGSPDNCPQMCDEWAKKDNRIKVVHKENDGLANARNFGMANSTGNYIMFSDSDDYLEADMIEYLYNLIVDFSANVSRCGFYFDFENKEESSVSNDFSIKQYSYEELMSDLVTGGHVSGVAWNKLYKRETVINKPYKKEDGCSEDILHNYRVYKDAPKTVFCDVPKYHYVVRENSITNNEFGYGAFDIIRAKNIILNGEKNNEKLLPFLVKGYLISAFIVLNGCLKNDACMDRYDDLRNSIIIHKDEVMKSDLYSKLEKIKMFMLDKFPSIYSKIIKLRG